MPILCWHLSREDLQRRARIPTDRVLPVDRIQPAHGGFCPHGDCLRLTRNPCQQVFRANGAPRLRARAPCASALPCADQGGAVELVAAGLAAAASSAFFARPTFMPMRFTRR